MNANDIQTASKALVKAEKHLTKVTAETDAYVAAATSKAQTKADKKLDDARSAVSTAKAALSKLIS